MSDSDNQVKFRALNMWANYIETGDVTMSAADAINMKQSLNNMNPIMKLKPLNLEQQKFVIRLREMAIKEIHIK